MKEDKRNEGSVTVIITARKGQREESDSLDFCVHFCWDTGAAVQGQ